MLPVLSKVLKKTCHSKWLSYLLKNKLLTEFQFGFRKQRSTKIAATHLCDQFEEKWTMVIWSVPCTLTCPRHLTPSAMICWQISCRFMVIWKGISIVYRLSLWKDANHWDWKHTIKSGTNILWSTIGVYSRASSLYRFLQWSYRHHECKCNKVCRRVFTLLKLSIWATISPVNDGFWFNLMASKWG